MGKNNRYGLINEHLVQDRNPPCVKKSYYGTEGHLSAVLMATTEPEFDNAFDAFLSKHVTITVNGHHISRDNYKKQLQGESTIGSLKVSTSVKFDGVVEVPTDPQEPVKAGQVGAFYVSTTELREMVLGAPAQTQVISSLNITIKQDTCIPSPPVSPIIGFFDARRVAVLNQVFVSQPVPIVIPFQAPPAPPI